MSSDEKPKKTYVCPLCSNVHSLGYCKQFRDLPLNERKKVVKEKSACFNCLMVGHLPFKCISKARCIHCCGKHHTLIHGVELAVSETEDQENDQSTSNSANAVVNNIGAAGVTYLKNDIVLLATARVKIFSESGKSVYVRALLDTGSDTALVSEWAVQALNLPSRKVNTSISIFHGEKVATITKEVDLLLHSPSNQHFRLDVSALVVRHLAHKLPVHKVCPSVWPHLKGFNLADPDFSEPGRIDLLLGADACAGTPNAFETPFGFVLMGAVGTAPSNCSEFVAHLQSQVSVNDELQKLWELEEVETTTVLSPDNEKCERQFQETHSRDSSGRSII